ncbi:MAG: HDOD domain-containing protein [Nitrospirae bacterium]|nr:MAG: HDOD domain-containing protein [Nitrospirota bacterium]
MPTVTPADIRRRIEKVGDLPTLPLVVSKIIAISNRPSSSAEELGQIIEKDQVLAAKVLKLANSPYYGFPRRIGSVSHAVVILGLNVVKRMTICASVFDMMKSAGMDQLWRHSLAVAMTAHTLATRAGLPHSEEVFVAGLLHDLGQVALYVKAPELAMQVEQVLLERDLARVEAEQEVLSLTHAEVAGWLAEHWSLPTSLKEPMMYHHEPTLARDTPRQTAIVHVADVLTKAMGCGALDTQPVTPLSPEAWKLVNLDDNALAACIEIAARDFDTIDDFL